jgi:hypothetical protein
MWRLPGIVMVGDVRRQMGLLERLGDWMGTGGRLPRDGAARGCCLDPWLGNGIRLPRRHSVSATRAPPDERAGCLGRGKGASRPFGIGLRPTLPSTSASGIGRVVGSAGECGRRRPVIGWSRVGPEAHSRGRRRDGGFPKRSPLRRSAGGGVTRKQAVRRCTGQCTSGAQRAKLPVVLGSPDSPVGSAYRTLADEVCSTAERMLS